MNSKKKGSFFSDSEIMASVGIAFVLANVNLGGFNSGFAFNLALGSFASSVGQACVVEGACGTLLRRRPITSGKPLDGVDAALYRVWEKCDSVRLMCG